MNISARDRKILMFILPVVVLLAYWMLLLSPKRNEAKLLADKVTQQQQKRDDAVAKADQLSSMKNSFSSDYLQVVRLGKAIPTTVDMPSLLLQLDSAANGTGIDFKKISVGARQPAAAAGGSTAATPPGGGGSQPAAAGGAPAQSAPGKTAENAGNAVNNANSNASADAQKANSATPTTPGATTTPSSPSAPGLDTVPLDFTFSGRFFNLADFFHRLKRFVYVTNQGISVQGRLMTIDTLAFTSDQSFPKLTAQVHATVYLAPKGEGTTAGATPNGPAASGTGAQPASGSASPSPAPTPTPPAATVTR